VSEVVATTALSIEETDTLFQKLGWRILPLLLLAYVSAFLDRVNVGFAALQMNSHLGFTPLVFGTGAGLFFLGYVLLEVPSNLILAKVGARVWLARIMITWGLVSAATGFVSGRHGFYAARILLGAVEAGFYPGLMFYLTLWFPRKYRARVFSLTTIAVPISSVIGSPLSSLILTAMNGWVGLDGWRWVFLIEGAPAVVIGLLIGIFLPSDPRRASFLTRAEQNAVAAVIAGERRESEHRQRFSVGDAMRDRRVLLMCLVSVGIVIGTTGAAIWMPLFVKSFGFSTLETGFVAAIPPLFTVGAVLFCGWNADRTRRPVAHVVVPFLCSAGGFLFTASVHSPLLGMIGLAIGVAGISSAVPSFWTLPTELLTGTASAAGIALINSVGSIGGFVGPYLIGWIRTQTGGFSSSLLFLAAVMTMAACIVLVVSMLMGDGLRSDISR
jgi:ACS family tartrate transporter-like MFS transporter